MREDAKEGRGEEEGGKPAKCKAKTKRMVDAGGAGGGIWRGSKTRNGEERVPFLLGRNRNRLLFLLRRELNSLDGSSSSVPLSFSFTGSKRA